MPSFHPGVMEFSSSNWCYRESSEENRFAEKQKEHAQFISTGTLQKGSCHSTIDSLITQLKERFDGENKRHTQAFFPLYHQSYCHWIQNSQTRTSCFGKKNLPTPKSLAGELRRWKHLWSNENPERHNQFLPILFMQALASCDADSFHYLLMIGCTLPIPVLKLNEPFLFYVELRHTHDVYRQKSTFLTLLS